MICTTPSSLYARRILGCKTRPAPGFCSSGLNKTHAVQLIDLLALLNDNRVALMKRGHMLIALLLVVCWFPATMHCAIAQPFSLVDRCCTDTHSETSSKPDCKGCAACKTLENGNYFSPQGKAFVKIQPEFSPVLFLLRVIPLPEQVFIRSESIPVLAISADDFCRAAHPIRAPSAA